MLGGATWSRDWWDDAFCQALAAEHLLVLRYDTRDTGESTLSPPGEPDYAARDLAEDAVHVLDAFGIATATIAGLSMGGGLAQQIAAVHRDRVAALALLSTSPAGAVGDLPGPSAAILATFDVEPPAPDWSDVDSVTDWVIEAERPYAGPGLFDEDGMRRLVAAVWARTPSMAGAANHFLVAESAPSVDLSALRGVPALVVHGSADPLFPLAHGEALARALDAPLLVLDGVGHQAPPPAVWPELVAALAALAHRSTR
nr:alpha/beta hydrolase [Nakamurella flavida]